jgi:plasmid maintenance system killer protein
LAWSLTLRSSILGNIRLDQLSQVRSGALSGHWSVSVNGNWRLIFAFENGDAILVDYQDYH